MLSLIDGAYIDMALKGVVILMLLATAMMSVRLAREEARLADASRHVAEVGLERDGALVELARSHGVTAPREPEAKARNPAEGRTEGERFEAAAEARELRIQALLARDPTAGESRFQTADRMIAEALRERRA